MVIDADAMEATFQAQKAWQEYVDSKQPVEDTDED